MSIRWELAEKGLCNKSERCFHNKGGVIWKEEQSILEYNGSSENTYNESNPYYYDTFLSIIKRYNIPSIINSGIQKILVEYSSII